MSSFSPGGDGVDVAAGVPDVGDFSSPLFCCLFSLSTFDLDFFPLLDDDFSTFFTIFYLGLSLVLLLSIYFYSSFLMTQCFLTIFSIFSSVVKCSFETLKNIGYMILKFFKS